MVPKFNNKTHSIDVSSAEERQRAFDAALDACILAEACAACTASAALNLAAFAAIEGMGDVDRAEFVAMAGTVFDSIKRQHDSGWLNEGN